MAKVEIEKVDGTDGEASSLCEEMKTTGERIRRHAFEIFESPGGGDGLAESDWLKAERDLFCIPESEMIERHGIFEIQLTAPGFEPEDVRVMALPDALLVRGSAARKHQGEEGNVHFCEFNNNDLFRRFDLPEPIDVDEVTANLDKVVLKITAVKARREKANKTQAVAA